MAGYQLGDDVAIAFDVASSEFFDKEECVYVFKKSDGSKRTAAELVDYYASSDGKKLTKLGRVVNKVDEKEAEVVLQDYRLQTNTKARYVKVMAKNITFNPDWHRAPGGTCWIFADEISIQ